jgi:hypothetical protein
MLVLTEDAGVYCKHMGKVSIAATQNLVTIAGRKVLVATDPEGRSISLCPNTIPFKPCTSTLVVDQGYSEWIRVDGRRLCLDTVSGFTDGTPPGVVKYVVFDPGQQFVSELG